MRARLGALVVLALGGCADAPPEAAHAPDIVEPAVTGRWRGEYEEVELFEGGRLLLRRGASRGLGRFEWVEPDRMLVTYEGVLAGSVPGDYRARVAGDSLSLCETDAPERCIRYVRWTPGSGASAARVDSTPPRLALPPRADQVPPEARMMEARGVLRQAYVLQLTHQAQYGEFAKSLFALREVGWEEHPLRHFHPLRLVRADERLCIVAEPRTPDLWPLYIDESGEVRQGRDCG